MRQSLDEMAVFVAVVEARGFRAAGERLGVSGSAVSQTLRRLEARLGVALVKRTTRSVHLTEAGDRLYAALRPALDQVQAAVEAVGAMASEPRGTLRLSVSGSAESFLSGPSLGEFLLTYPDIRLDDGWRAVPLLRRTAAIAASWPASRGPSAAMPARRLRRVRCGFRAASR